MEKGFMQFVNHPKKRARNTFIVGGAGAIISGVATLISFFGGFGIIWSFVHPVRLEFGSILFIVGGIILGAGLILAGIGYRGIKRNYGVAMGNVSFAFSIVTCVFVFVGVAFAIMSFPYTYFYLDYRNLWYPIYILSAIITLIIFGAMQILWGVAHINSRKHTGNSGLATATGILLMISGALTASVIIAFAGITLFFITEILVTIVFLTSNIPQQTTQTA